MDTTETVETSPKAYQFNKCRDSRGREVPGLWERNGRFYAAVELPGKGTRRVPLYNDDKTPVQGVTQAVAARNRILVRREKGELPGPIITPCFDDYVLRYLNFLEATRAKSPLTIKAERSGLLGWRAFFGSARLRTITAKQINDYALKRIQEDGVSTRTVNLNVIALGNLLRYAQREGLLNGVLPTDSWKPLKYIAPKRRLVEWSELEKLFAEALSTVKEGEETVPKWPSGQLLVDLVKLLAFSGARIRSGVSARWEWVNWETRQITFFSKFDKKITVDFNDRLEVHLKDLWARRKDVNNPWIFPSPRPGKGEGFFANPHHLLDDVKAACGVKVEFHDLRAYFASHCVMAGIDLLTVASWLGHSDGGALVAKVYGVLNPQHKRDSAQRVNFNTAGVQANGNTAISEVSGLDLTKLTVADLLALAQRLQALGIGSPPTPSATVPANPQPLVGDCGSV